MAATLTVISDYLKDPACAVLDRYNEQFCIWRNTVWIAQELVENRLDVLGRVTVAFHVVFLFVDSDVIVCN